MERAVATLLCTALLSVPFTARATTYLVNPDGTGDYPTIQAAILAAHYGDIVELASGTFRGDGNRDIDFLGRPIVVRSEDGDPATCIMDCEGAGSHPHRGWHFHRGEGPLSVLQGITVRNGYACGSPPECNGGAILCESSSPTIDHCVFSGNQAYGDAVGGAIHCSLSSLTLTRCAFVSNSAGLGGGGMSCSESSPTLTDCIFLGNETWRLTVNAGGGMQCYSSSPILRTCTFCSNLADCGGSGGAIGSLESTLTLLNCTLSNNSAWRGGGILCYESAVAMENTIIAFSPEGAGVACALECEAILTCCDIYGNAGGDWVGCIADELGVNGNISQDPLFCHPMNGDLRLDCTSACAPAQAPGCGLIGAWDVGCGSSGLETTTWSSLKGLYRSASR